MMQHEGKHLLPQPDRHPVLAALVLNVAQVRFEFCFSVRWCLNDVHFVSREPVCACARVCGIALVHEWVIVRVNWYPSVWVPLQMCVFVCVCVCVCVAGAVAGACVCVRR